MFGKNEHAHFIEDIARGMSKAGYKKNYLELGVAKGATFNRCAHMFDTAWAVDINQKALNMCGINDNLKAFTGTTDAFFRGLNKDVWFDMIFIDADHDFESVQKDFDNAYEHLGNHGIIILHDTHAPNKEYEPHCKDAWKIKQYIIENHTALTQITFPFYFGLTVVQYA